ncbi:MAG TPA: glycosyltransferase [Kiritimatiellia bacterium]|nr:glycosyltransferase [Kiritimatiellia bacterium]
MATSGKGLPPALRERQEFVSSVYKAQLPTRERDVHKARYYYANLKRLLRFIVEPGRRVLQVHCDIGHLLAAVQPARGLGLHASPGHLDIARRNHPELEFREADPHAFEVDESFDYVLLANAVGDIVDVEATLQRCRAAMRPDSRLVVVWTNYLWQPVFKLAERLGLKSRQPALNWFSPSDVENLLALTGFERVKENQALLLPINIPGVSWLFNRVLARIPPFHKGCYVKSLVARPVHLNPDLNAFSVSVIIPCKNEAGNVQDAAERIPRMGRHTEIIFCDDKSTDGTAEKVREMQRKYPDKDIKLVAGPGISKSFNVWAGFDAAQGDILMILDADLTTIPEELPYFFDAIASGRGEFINGSRMIYPMAEDAMKPLNVLGNKMFSLAFSYLLGQRIKDTLCGTKVLWKRDYERMKPLRGSWGVTDRWGDYELIFGAAKLNLKIIDLPVHYVERVYGETKMTKRFKNAAVMARMCWAALQKLRFA